MKLPREGWTPSHFNLRASAVEKVETKWSGFDAYRLSGKNFIRFLVPALDYFAVLSDNPAGRRSEYLDIRVGEQRAVLFEPPAGAVALHCIRNCIQ